MPIIGSVRVGMANAPSNPAEGELYYDTDDDDLRVMCNLWKSLLLEIGRAHV